MDSDWTATTSKFPCRRGPPPSIGAVAHQRLYEPHFDQSWTPDPRDTIRIGFGHTLSIPLPSQLGADVSTLSYLPFEHIPSYDNLTGQPATYCGPLANQLCDGQLLRRPVLAYPRLPLWQLDAGSAARRRDLYQRRPFVGARVSRWLSGKAYAVLPPRLQRYRTDRPSHRLQLQHRIAGVRRRAVLELGHSKGNWH